jgi:hypothetical protein
MNDDGISGDKKRGDKEEGVVAVECSTKRNKSLRSE